MALAIGQDLTHKVFTPIQRWYDRDAKLSELVRTLEALSPQSQVLFSHLLKSLILRLIHHRGRSFIQGVSWRTLIGIVKSKRSRRWYDQEHTMHVAFNMLYSLGERDQAFVGRELSLTAELVRRYELYAQARNEAVSTDMVMSIVETCFQQGLEQAQSVYSIFR